MTDDEKKTDEKAGNEPQPVSSKLDIKSERTVGELLLTAREKAGLSLEAVSLETKIPRKSLEYLETDNFEALPAKVYVRGFLRTYASVLGLDFSQILGKFELQTGQTHTSRGDLWEVEEAVVEEEVGSPRLFRKFVLPVLVAIIVIIALIWAISRTGGDDANPPRDIPGAVDTGGSGEPGTEETVDEDENETGGQAGDVSGGARADMNLDAVEPETNAGTPDGIKTVLEETARLETARLETTRREASAAKRTPAPMQLRIIADPGDTTWFDMVIYNETDSGTDSIFRDFILFPGQVENLTATDSFFFRTVGNAGGFTLELDGDRLPSLGRDGVVRKNVVINRDGIVKR